MAEDWERLRAPLFVLWCGVKARLQNYLETANFIFPSTIDQTTSNRARGQKLYCKTLSTPQTELKRTFPITTNKEHATLYNISI